jgi:hypothetical protein
MGNTILAKKEGEEMPIGKNDEVEEKLSKDPSIGNIFASRPAPINLTQAGENAAQNAEVLVKHDKESQDWVNKKWRPMMGWSYMVTCITDFVIFPILWSLLQALSKGEVTNQWQPITLMGAGLYHVAMGAVLGIAAFGRTKEKIECATKN